MVLWRKRFLLFYVMRVRDRTGETILKFMNSALEAQSASCEIKPTQIVDGVFKRQCSAQPSPQKN
jgi:hypothetical protein